jgi:small-conductance mechanosensitive channel
MSQRRLFETRSHAWREAGLGRQLTAAAARRARVEALILIPIFVAVVVAYDNRQSLLGVDLPVRVAAVIVLVVLGWAIARDVGRAAGPALFRRLDPATAGTAGFLIRLATVIVAVIVALRIAGLDPRTLAVGGAFTAVVLGLAAQQTLGNLIAGMVLLSARPFRVGERVRLQAGALGGRLEGVVSSLGLLYTTLVDGEEAVMVPNSMVLSAAVMPLREPEGRPEPEPEGRPEPQPGPDTEPEGEDTEPAGEDTEGTRKDADAAGTAHPEAPSGDSGRSA